MDKYPIIEKLFYYTAIYIDLVPVLLFLLFFKKCKEGKGLLILVISTFLSFVLNYTTSKIDPSNSSTLIILGHSFAVSEFVFFILFLWLNLKNKTAKALLVVSLLIFFIFFSIDVSKTNLSFNSLTVGVEAIIILSFSFYFLYELVGSLTNTFIYNDFRFWAIIGMVLYLSSSFFIYIYADNNQTYQADFWYVTYIFYIFKSLFLSIGIFIYSRQPLKPILNSKKEIPYLDIN